MCKSLCAGVFFAPVSFSILYGSSMADKKGNWLTDFWDYLLVEVLGGDFMKAFKEGVKMWKEFSEWGKGVLSEIDGALFGDKGKEALNAVTEAPGKFMADDTKSRKAKFEAEQKENSDIAKAEQKKAAETQATKNQGVAEYMKKNPLVAKAAEEAAAALNGKKKPASTENLDATPPMQPVEKDAKQNNSSNSLPAPQKPGLMSRSLAEKKGVKFADEDEVLEYGVKSVVKNLTERHEGPKAQIAKTGNER